MIKFSPWRIPKLLSIFQSVFDDGSNVFETAPQAQKCYAIRFTVNRYAHAAFRIDVFGCLIRFFCSYTDISMCHFIPYIDS